MRGLALIAGAGLLIRLVYALGVMHGDDVHGDGLQFHLLSLDLANGEGYRQPDVIAVEDVPTADKPPLFPLMLAGPAVLGIESVEAQRVISCLLGATLVALVGLLGRRVGGDRAGLIAAAIAAIYPPLVVLDGALRSESLYAPLIALCLLLAYRLVDEPSMPRAALLGLAIGAAALTRSEAVLLLLLLLVPALTLVGRGPRLKLAAVTTACCVLALSPWVVRNWIAFDEPTLSTNSGSLLAGANCDPAYSGPLMGSWPCFPRVTTTREYDEAEISARLRRQAREYVEDNTRRVPAVVGVRLMRTFDLWDPIDASRLESQIGDRDLGAHRAGVAAWWLLAALAVAGALALRRRQEPLRLLLAPLGLVIIVTVLGYGTTRFRVAFDIPAVVLAATAIGAWWGARRNRPGSGNPRRA